MILINIPETKTLIFALAVSKLARIKLVIFPCNGDMLDKTMANNSNSVSHLFLINVAHLKQHPIILNL